MENKQATEPLGRITFEWFLALALLVAGTVVLACAKPRNGHADPVSDLETHTAAVLFLIGCFFEIGNRICVSIPWFRSRQKANLRWPTEQRAWINSLLLLAFSADCAMSSFHDFVAPLALMPGHCVAAAMGICRSVTVWDIPSSRFGGWSRRVVITFCITCGVVITHAEPRRNVQFWASSAIHAIVRAAWVPVLVQVTPRLRACESPIYERYFTVTTKTIRQFIPLLFLFTSILVLGIYLSTGKWHFPTNTDTVAANAMIFAALLLACSNGSAILFMGIHAVLTCAFHACKTRNTLAGVGTLLNSVGMGTLFYDALYTHWQLVLQRPIRIT